MGHSKITQSSCRGGKSGAAAASIPPSLPALFPSSNPAIPVPGAADAHRDTPAPHLPPQSPPSRCPAGCQRPGEGGRMTQGDSESQFRLPVPTTGTRGQHTCGVKARLIITTPLQTGLRCRGKGETPTLGLQPGPEGLKSFGQTRPVALLSTYFRPCPLPAPTGTTASQSCFCPTLLPLPQGREGTNFKASPCAAVPEHRALLLFTPLPPASPCCRG